MDASWKPGKISIAVAVLALLCCGAGAARAQYNSDDHSNQHWAHERAACVADGGRWDWDNGICTLPNQTSWRYDPGVTHDAKGAKGAWYNGMWYLTR